MKKINGLLSLLLVASLAGFGCNKAGKLGEKSKSGPPTGPVVLKQKWTKGEKIIKSVDMKMDSEIQVPNQPNPIKQATTMEQKYGVNVVQENSDGGHEVELEFQSMNFKVDQGGQTVINYDSEKKTTVEGAGARTSAAFEKAFGGIIGAKLKFILNDTNGVDRVEGVDELMNKLMAGGPAMQNTGVKSMFNDEYLRLMLGDSRALPTQAVQPADTWPIKEDVNLGEMGKISVDYNVTFARWETHGQRLCARLEFDGTLKGVIDSASKTGPMSMSLDNGTTSGVTWFDPEIGAVIDSNLNQDLDMTMTMSVPVRGKPTKQTMKMKMHQVINARLDSVK